MTGASAPESRSERFPAWCGYCGSALPEVGRQDRKYCNSHCRRQAFERDASQGRVRSVRVLKSGDYSVTYHIRQTNMKPGDRVRED